MIDKSGNAHILEVNASPGTEGIEKISGVPVVEKVLEYVQDKNH
jgi:glutathione synthase/RimK-type ligase-like ATP-grasp enzyme